MDVQVLTGLVYCGETEVYRYTLLFSVCMSSLPLKNKVVALLVCLKWTFHVDHLRCA